MTIKRYTNSVKTNRRMRRIPAVKRIRDGIEAGAQKRRKAVDDYSDEISDAYWAEFSSRHGIEL